MFYQNKISVIIELSIINYLCVFIKCSNKHKQIIRLNDPLKRLKWLNLLWSSYSLVLSFLILIYGVSHSRKPFQEKIKQDVKFLNRLLGERSSAYMVHRKRKGRAPGAAFPSILFQ